MKKQKLLQEAKDNLFFLYIGLWNDQHKQYLTSRID